MLNRFLNFIRENKLFTKNQKILVAVSGGVDSVVLVDLLKKGNYHFAVAHCNFHLRGNESDGDESFVEQLALDLNVPFFCEDFDVKSEAKESGVSIQMAARNARYDWFLRLCSQFEYDVIATAHHKNDSIETVLYNLTKGTGLAGLHGIQPKLNSVVRPMLFATKENVLEYAESQSLDWREDSSNTSNKYFRNLIRNEVIPILKKINPNLEETFEVSVEKLKYTEDFFLSQVDSIKNILVEERGGDYWISIPSLKKYKGFEIILFQILSEFGFNYTQVRQVFQSFNSQSGKVFYAPSYLLSIDRSYLVITSHAEEVAEQQIFDISESVKGPNFELRFEIIDNNNLFIDPSKDIAFIDLDEIEFPIKLRAWSRGDRFYPLGMTKKKKLSDFLIDNKVPINLKSRIFVLTTNNSIFWVIGHRIDNRFKVTKKTRRVLKIEKTAKHG